MSESSFLYPFLHDAPAPVSGPSLAELSAAALASWEAGEVLDDETVRGADALLDRAVEVLVAAAAAGHQLLTLGNGGSACDADRLVRLLGALLPARSLLDAAIVSALANDIGAGHVFDRQVETYAQQGDVIAVFTTSGTSANVIAAAEAARRSGAQVIAFAGYGGGTLRGHAAVDVCFGVESSSVHRIQEAQGALCDALLQRLRKAMAA